MQDKWYGDNRDLAKWGVLLHLAGEYKAATILQVAYLRKSEWRALNVDGVPVSIPGQVLGHFRRVQNIKRLKAGPEIEVLDTVFKDRKSYTAGVVKRVGQDHPGRQIIFLDPDTGLEPAGRAGLQHVLASDLKAIWGGAAA